MSYILKTGTKGLARLNVVNLLYNSDSLTFIEKAPIQCNNIILDIGCGTGIIAIHLAQRVKDGGKVIAVDQSIEQINLAKQNAIKFGVNNIEFIVDDATNLRKYKLHVDLIYSRLVLVHQQNPNLLFEKYMYSLKPNGIIICEEPITSSSFYSPTSNAFNKHLELYLEMSQRNNLDFNFGKKLLTFFDQNHLPVISYRKIQNTFTSKKIKTIALLRTLECADIYLKYGLISEESLNTLISELKLLVNNSDGIISGVEMVQIIGRKV